MNKSRIGFGLLRRKVVKEIVIDDLTRSRVRIPDDNDATLFNSRDFRPGESEFREVKNSVHIGHQSELHPSAADFMMKNGTLNSPDACSEVYDDEEIKN